MADDPRRELAQAQMALERGDLTQAGRAFERAAYGFAGPAELLGAGHGLRGLAQVAMRMGSWERSRDLLDQAKALYQAGSSMARDLEGDAWEALQLDLIEAEATTLVLDADVSLRRGSLRDAREQVDRAVPLYEALQERPSISDLHTVQARLAEREGQWKAARSSWSRVVTARAAHHDEWGVCNARIRMAEAMIAEGDVEAAHEALDEARLLARELDDTTLQGRTSVARARALETELDWSGAWEKWQDALMELADADPVSKGLAQVRMARTAARMRPSESWNLLEDGLHDLVEGGYPDAVGLVLHQLAVVALSLGKRRTGALAAAGAERARPVCDASLRGLLYRALLGIGAREAAFLLARRENLRLPNSMPEILQVEAPAGLDLDDPDAVDARYRRVVEDALHGPLLENGLTADELGSRRMVFRLAGGVTEQVTPVADDDEPLELVWSLREGELLRHALTGIQLVGRGRANAVRMSWDALASRTHCAIEARDDGVWVRDLDSHHGTFVDGERVEGEHRLAAGERLRVGETDFAVAVREVVKPAVAAVAIPV